MGKFCDCTNRVVCDPHRCTYVNNGKRCNSPRIWEREGCQRHAKLLPHVVEDFEVETLTIDVDHTAADEPAPSAEPAAEQMGLFGSLTSLEAA